MPQWAEPRRQYGSHRLCVCVCLSVVTKTQDGTEPGRDVPSHLALLKFGIAGWNSEFDCVLNHGTHLKLAV